MFIGGAMLLASLHRVAFSVLAVPFKVCCELYPALICLSVPCLRLLAVCLRTQMPNIQLQGGKVCRRSSA